MKYFARIFSVVFVLALSSCSLTDLEANLENPNEVGVSQLDVNLLMNKVQADFADFFSEVNFPAMDLSRQNALTNGDIYSRAYQPQDFNTIWELAYQDVMVQIETLLGKTDGTGLSVHSGAGRVLKAYVMLTLVDLFGNVPYSQALKGVENFNPGVDQGAAVYTAAIALLDEAIALFAKTQSATMTRDIYYGGDKAKWTALANTLKLKAYLNLRLTNPADSKAKIEALLTANLIDTDAEEFTYKYGTADNPGRSRHDLYRQYYRPVAGDASGYISNYFMWNAYKQKGVEDPRWRYYFYRQVGSINKAVSLDPESVPCRISPRPGHYPADMPWCSFDPGFFGRDHGNNDGIPPDGFAITCPGVYPAGGRSDNNPESNTGYAAGGQQGQGANGAGIDPIWMASFTDFLKAEAALTLGTTGDPAALLDKAVKGSIARVKAFATAKNQALSGVTAGDEAAYTAKVAELYTAATNKLDVIAKEWLLASWGNGIEGYNLYRRTGFPSDIQLMRAENPGNFLYSLVYPADFVNLNSSTPQKNNQAVNKVFWDNNPDNFCR